MSGRKLCTLEQLEQPLPQGIRCRVKLALRKDDDGSEFNRVRRFEVIGVDKPEADAFAPADGDPGDKADAAQGDETRAAAGEADKSGLPDALPAKPDDGIPV